VMQVWRDGDRLVTQLQAEQVVEIFPQSEHNFFAKVVDVQIAFEEHGGAAAAFVLRQNGKDHPAKRLEETVARQRSAELTERIRNQTPALGTESELRRHIAEIQSGTPEYARMSPELAEAIRARLTSGHSQLKPLGAVQSVQFESVSPAGVDLYEVRFERGTAQWRIKLGPDGKISTSLLDVQP